MRKCVLFVPILLFVFTCLGQTNRLQVKKYPSLLWEITGNGLTKPSYLFGTMHVSNKLAFNLSDSFYLGIRNADVVALENNPELWQEEMTTYNSATINQLLNTSFTAPNEYLTINTLQIKEYEKIIEIALAGNSPIINNLLYRSFLGGSDFEEDTYLDMYIYQAGKKWGKKIAGVEDYKETMKLVAEAYSDARKQKNRKQKSFDFDEEFSINKLREAYRTGNLDLLDTINQLNSTSAAFDEKFMYKRNEIQAASIDSILKTRASLFVGVGAAHLPGYRGVIEILRNKGYQLRPIMMGARDSYYKETIEKIKVPVTYTKQISEDGFYKVDIPGKFYRFTPAAFALTQQHYADMANGSYYSVSRINTNALMWGHNVDDVYRKVDSVLYENVPGKILSKKSISKNGYQGFEVTNRTRRGDYQRYNIFITPVEILLFKISGIGDYVADSTIANRFFNSIELKEPGIEWKTYQPATGGFKVSMPHEPFVQKSNNWQYTALDKNTGISVEVIRTDVHNYNFIEEDTFDLALMEESFMSSKFINKQLTRKQTKQNGYPALDAKYSHKNGSVSIVKYVIQGPHYYTLIAHGKKEHPKMLDFLNSFTITPYYYGKSEKRIDTSLSFTVTTPVFPEENKMPLQGSFGERYEDEEEALMERGIFKNKLIVNDTTGEKIYVSYYKPPKYNNNIDSSRLNSIDRSKASWIIENKRKYELPNKIRVWEYAQMDTGSSRFIWNKLYYKDGIEFLIRTQSDTLSEPSTFLTGFFETFLPADTARDLHSNIKKSTLFFNDFFSKDSIAYKKAIKNINMAEFDGTDLPLIQKAINSLTWKEKKYIDIKKQFISKLSDVPGKASAEYLKQLYYSAGDTVELQYVALKSLLRQKTPYAYTTFKNIMLNEPPVLNVAGSFLSPAPPVSFSNSSNNNIRLSNGVFIDNLRDSLQLTATIFKDLLPLIDLDDYKLPLIQLLGTLVDSGFIEAGDYKMYLPKLLPEARQQLKKQIISEKNKSIRKAQADETNTYEYNRYMVDQGNNLLSLYASLLLPFWDINENVPVFFQQLLSSSDNRLKYNTALLLLRKGKPVPDSVLRKLAVSDKYQYDLYNDLRKLRKNNSYKNFNATELAKSRLISSTSMYYVFDSIQFLDRLPVTYKGKKGFIYFFKYKQRRDDNNWKLASSGLMPINLATDKTPDNNSREENFTQFSATKINNEEPLKHQLEKALKQLLYAKRQSARQFYSRREAPEADFRF